MLQTKRIYEPQARGDGARFFVERLWPRGIKKEELRSGMWLKDVAPSAELREWFSHDPAKWNGFKRKYRAELKKAPATWQPLLTAARRGNVTLLYSARDVEHNSAILLKEFLDKQLKPPSK